MTSSTRKPHVVMDAKSRRYKALKIERLLNLTAFDQPIHMLEIGTGSGGIAHYFAIHADLVCNVNAIDVVDSRAFQESFSFELVRGIDMPFADNSFDVVLTNHVIEHVGDRSQQLAHLEEIRRVLKSTGIGYLAVPNRWMLVEPHYKLAFLSWLPERFRSHYLEYAGRGDYYDCNPLSLPDLDALLTQAGLQFRHVEAEALDILLDIEEGGSWSARAVNALPNFILDRFRRLMPTLICTFRSETRPGM